MRSTSFCGGIKSSMNPENIDSLYARQVKQKLAMILDLMNDMQRQVLQLRLGLIDGVEMSIEEVAVKLGESRQQIRKWEEQALRIMHHPELACNKADR